MKERNLTVPEIAQIAGTRAILGVGIGLILADKLTEDQRKGIGWTLLAVGLLSTIPIAANLLGKKAQEKETAEFDRVGA